MSNARYKGKRKDNGEWLEGAYGILGEETDIERHVIMVSTLGGGSIPYFYFTDYEVIPETVGQYTGMKDKNGVEIYEGDVVDYRDEDGAIVFEDCEFLIQFDTWSAHLGEFYPRELEVIGNIHDNPEYLEVPHDRRAHTIRGNPMSTESDIIAYRRKKQTEKMRRFREIYQRQKDTEAKRSAKESEFVRKMRKQIAEEIRRIEEDNK